MYFWKKAIHATPKKCILWKCTKIVDSWDFALDPNRVVQGSDGPAGRVGSRFCRILAGRVGSALRKHLCSSSPEPFCGSISNEGPYKYCILLLLLFRIFSFLLIISWYLNRYEFSNTTFGLIDFLRYLIYVIIKLLINNYSIKLCTYERRVGPRVGSSRVRLFVGNRGSGQRFAGTGRVQEKWPVDNSAVDNSGPQWGVYNVLKDI